MTKKLHGSEFLVFAHCDSVIYTHTCALWMKNSNIRNFPWNRLPNLSWWRSLFHDDLLNVRVCTYLDYGTFHTVAYLIFSSNWIYPYYWKLISRNLFSYYLFSRLAVKLVQLLTVLFRHKELLDLCFSDCFQFIGDLNAFLQRK